MARIVQSGNPLFTLDEVTRPSEGKAAPERKDNLKKIASLLGTADALTKNPAIGAWVNMLMKGAKSVGNTISDYSTISDAENAAAEQQKLNVEEAGKVTSEAASLKEQAAKKLAEAGAKPSAEPIVADIDVERKRLTDESRALIEANSLAAHEPKLQNTRALAVNLRKLAALEPDPVQKKRLIEESNGFFKEASVLENTKPTEQEYGKVASSSVVENISKKIIAGGKPSIEKALLALRAMPTKNEDQNALYNNLSEYYKSINAAPVPKTFRMPIEGEAPIPEMGAQEIVGGLAQRDIEQRKAMEVEAKTLQDQAVAKEATTKEIMARKAALPEGVTVDPTTGAYNVTREEPLSEDEILAMATTADTPEKRNDLMKQIQSADITPTNLLDIMSGGHKRRFSAKVVSLFPKTSTARAETESDAALKRARTKKLLAETKEIASNADATRKQKIASADKATQGALDLKQKVGADYKGIEYWKSVIIKNLREPKGRSGRGGSGLSGVKSLITDAEKQRDKQLKDTGAVHDSIITGQEAETKSLIEKKNQLVKEAGEFPVAPTSPAGPFNTTKAKTDAMEKFNKENSEYNDEVRARQDLDKNIETSTNRLNTMKADKNKDLDDIDQSASEVLDILRNKAGYKVLPKTKKRVDTAVDPLGIR